MMAKDFDRDVEKNTASDRIERLELINADLLEALQELLSYIENPANKPARPLENLGFVLVMIMKARAAIAKATGKH